MIQGNRGLGRGIGNAKNRKYDALDVPRRAPRHARRTLKRLPSPYD
jgi:hypothetical protein